MPLSIPLAEIGETDLQSLIEGKVAEQKTIEYKVALPDNSHDSRREFLADVSSFANTAGGDILFGVAEDAGIPIDLPGVGPADVDAEILRLENLLRDGIEPRMQGASMRAVPLQSGTVVLVVRVPESWNKPHAVSYQGHWRFYARNSAGKYALDVQELRSAFMATEATVDRIRRFHFDRLERIRSNESPVPLPTKAKVVLHMIPYSAFSPGSSLDLESVQKEQYSGRLIYAPVSGTRFNLDGFLLFDEPREAQSAAYLQIFRSGIFESVSTRIFTEVQGQGTIPSVVFEQELSQTLASYVAVHRDLSIAPPTIVLVALLGVRGFNLAVKNSLDIWFRHTHNIDRDALLLPDVLMEDYGTDPTVILRPVFDSLWNAAGWSKSLGYDDAGNWGKGPNFLR